MQDGEYRESSKNNYAGITVTSGAGVGHSHSQSKGGGAGNFSASCYGVRFVNSRGSGGDCADSCCKSCMRGCLWEGAGMGKRR